MEEVANGWSETAERLQFLGARREIAFSMKNRARYYFFYYGPSNGARSNARV
jgi:hypothetical protein